MRKVNHKGLLDRKRFEVWEKEEILALRRMTVERSIKIMEGLLDSGIIDEFRRIQKELDAKECQKS